MLQVCVPRDGEVHMNAGEASYFVVVPAGTDAFSPNIPSTIQTRRWLCTLSQELDC
jgi:hypothetical protein